MRINKFYVTVLELSFYPEQMRPSFKINFANSIYLAGLFNTEVNISEWVVIYSSDYFRTLFLLIILFIENIKWSNLAFQ